MTTNLSAICRQFASQLALMPGIAAAYYPPPPSLGEDVSILIYPIPGQSLPDAHRGRGGGLLYRNTDDIAVEYHHRISPAEYVDAFPGAIAFLENIRTGVPRIWQTNKFNETVDGIGPLVVDRYGHIGWGSDYTFGVRVRCEVRYMTEVPTDTNWRDPVE